MKRYLFELCKADGSTPLGENIKAACTARDRNEAHAIILGHFPEYEVCSWGCVDDFQYTDSALQTAAQRYVDSFDGKDITC